MSNGILLFMLYRIRCTALYKNNDILNILVMTKQIHYQIWFKLDSFSWWSMILVLFSAHHYPSYWNFKIITLMHFLMDACKKWGLSSLLMIRDDCEYRFAKHTSLNSKKSYFNFAIYTNVSWSLTFYHANNLLLEQINIVSCGKSINHR